MLIILGSSTRDERPGSSSLDAKRTPRTSASGARMFGEVVPMHQEAWDREYTVQAGGPEPYILCSPPAFPITVRHRMLLFLRPEFFVAGKKDLKTH